MAVTRADKAAELDALQGVFGRADAAILIDYKGINVPQVTELRRELRKARARVWLVVNKTDRSDARISEVVDSSGGDDLVLVTALGIEYDLAEGAELLWRTWAPLGSGGGQDFNFTFRDTMSAAVTTFLSIGAPSYFAAGTVTPSVSVAVPLTRTTALAALLAAAEQANAAAGAQYEISARRNGTTDYKLDFTAYGSSATSPDLRTGKSLLGVRRTLRANDLATRVFGFGSDGGTIGGAHWKVTAVSLNSYIEIADIEGSTINPILADDQFNNLYWIHEDGVTHQITDTDRANKRLYMASTTGIAANEWGKIAQDSAGVEVYYLDSAAAQATYGVRTASVTADRPSHTNWFKNPDFADDGTSWSITGSVTYNAAFYQEGGQSLKPGAGSNTVQSRVIYVKAGQTVVMACSVYLTANCASGTWGDSAVGGVRFTDPQTGANTDVILDTTSLNQWVTLRYTFPITSTGTKTATITFSQGASSAAVWYVDWALLTWDVDSIPGTLPSAFVRGSGAAVGWLKSTRHLELYAAPVPIYEASILDLYRLDPSDAGAYEALSLGGTANMADTDLEATTAQRVMKIITNHTLLHDTKILLASAPEQFTRVLAA